MASDLARHLRGEIFAASGGFVGGFPTASPDPVGYRDHYHSPPRTVDGVAAMFPGGDD